MMQPYNPGGETMEPFNREMGAGSHCLMKDMADLRGTRRAGFAVLPDLAAQSRPEHIFREAKVAKGAKVLKAVRVLKDQVRA